MRNRLITALTLLTGILLICSFALGEDVTLTVGGQTFTCAADATQIDLGDVTVPDTDERMVLRYRYIHNMTWEQIGSELNADKSTVRRWHGNALAHVVLPDNPIKIFEDASNEQR